MTAAQVWDARACHLGEGALWHPGRGQLFWFDILGQRLMSRDAAGVLAWSMPWMASAAGVIDDETLLIAAETGLWRFSLATGALAPLAAVPAGEGTRSNDGRADRQGGFWFGTMGKRGGQDPGKGAIWRWHGGEVRRLFSGLTIPNSICFAPDGRSAHFSDTLTHRVMRVALDPAGWPAGEPEVWLDLSAEGRLPDGAVIDAAGAIWLAQWGSARVAVHAPDGTLIATHAVGAPQPSCPAFGGPALGTLYVTTAHEGMDAPARAAHPLSGQVFALRGAGTGLPEPKVLA